jgi:hypothetical protein
LKGGEKGETNTMLLQGHIIKAKAQPHTRTRQRGEMQWDQKKRKKREAAFRSTCTPHALWVSWMSTAPGNGSEMPQKRTRGRPRKASKQTLAVPKRPRGRPPKTGDEEDEAGQAKRAKEDKSIQTERTAARPVATKDVSVSTDERSEKK